MSSDRCILTYNGIDGACAAAMTLLRYPEAEIHVTSAARVGRTIRDICQREKTPSELHVCGLGVWCDWQEVQEPARVLAGRGCTLLWYCGRGYLDPNRGRFGAFCTPVFLDLGTNTAAVSEHLQRRAGRNAERLRRLARCDPHNEAETDANAPDSRQRWWMDYLEASISQYFKYHDVDAYTRAIRRLAKGEKDTRARQMVEVFRKAGMKYVLRGKSEALTRLRETIRRCAEADEHVLITGESGVGKEYVAHLLHERSTRAMGPMIPVNCALFAGNEGLANSVLFGHLKGAFTGANDNRPGAFVTADSGILFLDEVGELPPEVQAKFLRVIEDGWVTPEGADRPREKVNVRVVGATKRDLPSMVRKGTFRDDLYHRLDILRIRVPPLRDHPEDIPAIAEQTFASLAPDADGRELQPAEHSALCRYGWPGNVRQLIKVLKRTVFLDMPVAEALEEERRFIPDGAAACHDGQFLPSDPSAILTIEELKATYARHALDVNGGNYTDTARKLDISPNTLRRYVQPD